MQDPDKAFVPDCDWDVFLSYAWANNRPATPHDETSGWAHRFRESLRDYLDEKLKRYGGRAKVFFDTYSVRQQKDFQVQVDAGVSRSAVMVALVSDAWIGSTACQGELSQFDRQFNGAANQSGRLFPVHLEQTRDWPEQLVKVLHGVKGYDFYEIDAAEQISRRHRLESENFVRSLEVLRERIAEQLITLWKQRTASRPGGERLTAGLALDDSAPAVYLAEAVGVKRVQEELESYFRSARIRVLPERTYPRDAASFRAALQADLASASVFVQVFGAAASTRSEELPRGYEGLQLEAAGQLHKPILQWRAPHCDPEECDEPDHGEMARKAGYFGTLIEFAQAVREKVDRLARGGPPPDPIDARKRWVLIKAEQADDEYAGTLTEYLSQHDIRCRVAPNGLPTLDRLKEHRFDAVLMVYGKCSQTWIEERSDELMDVLQDRKDQAPICGFYLDRPRTPPLVIKDIIQRVVHQDPVHLDNLLQAIRRRECAE